MSSLCWIHVNVYIVHLELESANLPQSGSLAPSNSKGTIYRPTIMTMIGLIFYEFTHQNKEYRNSLTRTALTTAHADPILIRADGQTLNQYTAL